MNTAEAHTTPGTRRLHDVVALVKPGVSAWNLLMVAGGMALADTALDPLVAGAALLAMAALVGAANALNMAIEVATDRKMPRAAGRPLAAGRLHRGGVALAATLTAVAALAALWLLVNPLAAFLGLAALLLYVAVYTPLKPITPWAAVPGAVAGALPPLIGWAAATGRPGVPGLALFTLLLIWQAPHVLAISLQHEREYERAGLWVPSMVLGAENTRLWIFVTASLTVSMGIALGGFGLAGPAYLLFAFAGGVLLMARALPGLERVVAAQWPRRLQRSTVMYLLAIAAGLSIDWLL